MRTNVAALDDAAWREACAVELPDGVHLTATRVPDGDDGEVIRLRLHNESGDFSDNYTPVLAAELIKTPKWAGDAVRWMVAEWKQVFSCE